MQMPLPPAERTLPGLLQHQAQAWGDRPLLSLDGSDWTHAEPARLAAGRAAALQAAGVQRGDRVLLMCGNRPEFLDVFLGCGWMGAVVVPVNTAAMGPQLGYFLANSGAKLLVIEATFAERLAQADLGATGLQQVWTIDTPSAEALAACG
ncbi:MAG: AMP-binding protein, partial [Rubrivivax sp.]